jgi:carboxymethylenebutenolidase
MEEKQDQRQEETSNNLSRRDFIALAAAAGIVAATDSASAAMPVSETDVTIKTSDGTCDAAFIHPTSGSHPAVIVWSDAFGLRPAMRDIGKRIAAEGYSVLVPNPFYRVKPGPAVDNITSFNFQTDMPKIQPLMASINAPGNCEKDAAAFVAWLDQQKQVNTSKKIGTQGYCMGGPLVLKTCATRPDRVGAGGSFHGGGLVTDKPDSPHLLIPQMKAEVLCCVADNDDKRDPTAKDKLKEAFAAAHLKATVEVFEGCDHGWTVRGSQVYNEAGAERAWAERTSLYKRNLS